MFKFKKVKKINLNIGYYEFLKNFILAIFLAGYSKILVATGESMSGYTNDIEIIDLELTACENLPNFPSSISQQIGGLGFTKKPYLCGGHIWPNQLPKNCFTLKNRKWKKSEHLAEVRLGAAMSQTQQG
jgi:hypothetical protein